MLKASDEYQLYQAAQSVAEIFEATNKRAEEISARASAQRFRIEIDAKIKESIQKIEDKNTEMKSSFDERAFGEGYTVKNGYYRKKIVKDVSVFSVDTENVKVRMWKDFEANDPEVNLSLLEENVDAVSFSVIMTLISAQLTDWENSIFGVSGVASTGDDKASTKNVSYIVGEFEKYAYGEQYKGEVELGKGLVGAILLDFEKNSQKEKAGWEALDAPTWERKLWCSDTFPGPSIREFSTMVASIAATVCTFGAGAVLAVAVSAAVMAANELTFELADVSVGYHDWDEAAKNVAKAAVSGAITGAASSLSGVASQVGGMGGVFLKTGITSSSSITTQFTNAFIDGGFSGVKDAFNSWSDWQGIAFSTAGSFVTNGVGYSLANTNFTGFNSLQMSQINSIAGTVGGLTTNALEYAFTGQTSFNLLNLSMFGLEYGSMWGAQGTSTLSGGLFSMTLGKDGAHFAISSAGTDISLGTLYSNAMGIGHIVENSKIENYASDYGNPSAATTLRIQYGYGDKESNTLLDEILSGKTKLSLTSEKKDGATAQTTTDANGNKTVTLYGITADMSVEDMFKAGLVLQHEAHRDGVNGDNQSAETVSAVAAHTDMMSRIVQDELYAPIIMQLVKDDKTLQADLIAKAKGSESFEKYVNENYDSTADYWRLMSDGSLAFDGSGNLYDENGNLILKTDKGIQNGLAQILGIDPELARQMIANSGFDSVPGSWDVESNYGKSITFGSATNDGLTYGQIYDNSEHKITDYLTGQNGTLKELNPKTIYDNMVANGTMDVKEEYTGFLGSIIGFFTGDEKYITYDDFKANNYITGGIPQEGQDYKVGDPLNVKNGNYDLITTMFLAMGDLGTHYGIDLSAVLDTAVYALLYNENTEAKFYKNLNGAGGNYTELNLDLTYLFKGQMFNDSILQRYMHLNSQSENFSGIFADSSFALSGNSGSKTTAPHLHIDISSAKTSPWLDYMSKTNGYNSYNHPTTHRTYYAPEMFLKYYKWKNENAKTYNK